MDFSLISKKIFGIDPRIRGLTIGTAEGSVLHFEMQEGIETVGPKGEMGKMDAEVLFPAMVDYFDRHKKHFGKVRYMLTKFEKVSIVYIKSRNLHLVVSIEPGIDTYLIVKKTIEVFADSTDSKSERP